MRKKKINQIKKAIEIENEKEEAKGPIVFISDPNEMARFPGNYPSSLFDWVERNKSIIQYHGRVGVQFVVECDGSLSNIKITRHSMAADEDIIRLVKKMPKWIPAHQDGKAVRSIVNINLDI